MSKLFLRFKSLTQYVSDVHLERGFVRNIKPEKPFLILAGDIGHPFQKDYSNFLHYLSRQFDKVFVLSGNHEYDFSQSVEYVDSKIQDICSMRNNLFFVQKNTHVLCEENNLHLAGCTLWSKLPRSKAIYYEDHKRWLKNLLDKNSQNNYIVATHHCPLFECLDKTKIINYLPNYFASDQSEIIKKQNLVAWVHGHSHLNKNIYAHDKWILSNQYGYSKYALYGYKK